MTTQQHYATLSRAQELHGQITRWADGPDQIPSWISTAGLKIFTASLIRDIARQMRDPKLGRSSAAIAREVLAQGVSDIAQDFEEGRFCGTLPGHITWPPKHFDPREDLFAGVTPDAMDKVRATVVRRLADAVTREPAEALAMAG